MAQDNKGFTYVEILISIAIISIFLSILFQFDRYSHRQRAASEEISRMTMVAQGVIEAYRTLGYTAVNNDLQTGQASVYGQGYTVTFPVPQPVNELQYPNLKKAVVTVQHRIPEVDDIKLITYDTNAIP